ncbi:MAG: bacterial transcriptional activator domain-containing protein, partial [Ktedonobacteraceae bacterium]|nr:bacterial transcriptional activator domain-containing protein [Ktedonobacteraceae bacterium]
QQELRQAEKVIEGLLREDPTDESALCRLMHILHTQGLTAEALRRCKQVAALLARQGLSLSPETEMLAKELQSRPRIMTHAAPILGVPSSPDMNEVEVRGNLHTQEGITPVLANAQIPITDVYVSTIENLATITQQYRLLQLAGFATEDGLRSHINLIQSTLETTVNGKYRCELWRILAQSQILARHSITKKRELGRARTWNEAAIASARYSGDTLLLGTTIGHLGHLYLTWQHDPVSAGKLLEQAQEYTRGHPVNGWFAMVAAAIAAAEENHNECEASVARATEVVGGMPMTAEYTDLFYTDFNIAGTDAFAGNCLLKVGEPTKALERLTSINLEVLAENRHASTLYDIACAHAATGDLEAMQVYAFRSIDKALATNRLYILPRFVTLAQKIQAKDRHETHAAAVAEYIHTALHQ